MSLLLDPRAGSGDLLPELQKHTNGDVTHVTLNSGDVAWEGNYKTGTVFCGLEIKTIPDMMVSLRSGRYLDQLHRMQEDYGIVYLLLEGSYRPSNEGFLEVP